MPSAFSRLAIFDRRYSGGVVPEDAAHDRRLDLVDDKRALHRCPAGVGSGAVAVDAAAAAQPLQDLALEPPPNLVGQTFQEHAAEDRGQAN